MQNEKQSVFIDIREAAAILGYSERHARRVLEEKLPPMKQSRIANNATGIRGSAVRWVRAQVIVLKKELPSREQTRRRAGKQQKSKYE